MRYIDDIGDNDFILSNEEKVPICKDEQAGVKQVYRDYLFALTEKM